MVDNFFAHLYFKPQERQTIFGIISFDKPCPDQIVGTYNLDTYIFFKCDRVNVEYYKENGKYISNFSDNLKRVIIILLESPHIDEFNSMTGVGLGPAMGKTGDNFYRFFEGIFQSSTDIIKKYTKGDTREFDVIFVNADQYQCSLGISPLDTKIRDDNFKVNFEHNRGDLILRLSALAPVVLINCVTSGLKSLVDEEIKNNFKKSGCLYFNSTHPSSWHYPNNRKMEFVKCF